MLTVVTRDGQRPACLETLKASLNGQGVRHVLLHPTRTNERCFYNSVLNQVRDKVKEGWVMILDDDSVVIRKNFGELVTDTVRQYQPTQVLLLPSLITPRKLHFPIPYVGPMPRHMRVDMSNLCVHSSLFQTYAFSGRCSIDYKFLKALHKSNHSIVHRADLPPLVWANYGGAHHGRNITCRDPTKKMPTTVQA